MVLSIAIGLLVASLFTVASFVLGRSSKSTVNKTFAIFTLSTGIWITANYIGANFKDHSFSQYFIHADLFSGSFLVYTLWFFTVALLSDTGRKLRFLHFQKQTYLAALVIAGLVAFSTFYPQVIGTIYHNDSTSITYGSSFIFYSVGMLIGITLAIVNMLVAYRLSHGKQKQQIKTMIAGLTVAVGFVAISNLLVPIITTSSKANLITGNLAYIGIAIFIASTYYSIVRHKLFDLRLIIARTIAYSLSIGTFTLIYVALAFFASTFLIKDYEVTLRQSLVTVGLMIVLVITINPVRHFFDRSTSRLFYRDAYDPQAFLDELNKTLIDNIEIGVLLRHTAKVIADNLKSERVVFALYNDKDNVRFIDSSGQSVIRLKDMDHIRHVLHKTKRQTIVYDDLNRDIDGLKVSLRKNNIAVISSLQAGQQEDRMAQAYLAIGEKKTGNSYNAQDLRIIEIIVNELVIAIQNALRFEEIQNFNVTLQQRVNDATRKLRRANEKLKQLDETKDDFISMASHQLRTPLTSVKGYLSMVLEGDVGKINDKQNAMLSQAFYSSQRMVYLIADLLNVSRLKTGKFIIEPAKVNLAEVIQDELGQLQETAKSRSLTLVYDKPKNFPDLMLDETKTRQVIMNFSDNAIYYTPAGGKVEIKLIETLTTIEMRVLDNGIGVPKEDQAHLFTKFYRGGNARKARPDGTGLGLFMAKKVIIAQGGALIFESKTGKGSTFGFVFSKAKLAVPKDYVPKPVPGEAQSQPAVTAR